MGNTPLDEAQMCGNKNLIKLLEDATSAQWSEFPSQEYTHQNASKEVPSLPFFFLYSPPYFSLIFYCPLFLFLHLHLSHNKPKSPWPKFHSRVIFFSFLNPPRVLAILFLNCATKLSRGLELRSQHLEDKVFLMGQEML